MPLLPDEVSPKSFRRRWWRGYDHRQVDAFLGEIATDYAAAITRIATLADERAQAEAHGEELRRELESMREAATSGRADAERDATAIRERAEHGAAAILRQAEETAAALTRHAESLRSAAQEDADAARRRVETAERRARETDDAARQRWDALRVETEQRWERLRTVERQMDQRITQADRALAALRSRIALLDQVDEVEQLVAAIRADVDGAFTDPRTAVDGASPVSP